MGIDVTFSSAFLEVFLYLTSPSVNHCSAVPALYITTAFMRLSRPGQMLTGSVASMVWSGLLPAAMPLVLVACQLDPATGVQGSTLTVQIVTDGHDLDSNGYSLVIGARDYPIEINDTVTITDLPPTDYPVSLAGIAPNCNPGKANPTVIRIAKGDTSKATLTIHCEVTLNGRLVFSTDRDGNWEIYSIRIDGSDPVNLTNDQAFDSFSTVSVALDQIFFMSSRLGRNAIFRMNPNGTDVRYVVDGTGPSISPDGTRLAFMPDSVNGEIFELRLDIGSVVNLTNTPLRWEGLPEWAPDGNRIAFGSGDSVGDHVYVMNADGSNITPVVSGMQAYWPRWSPDGSKLVFSGYRSGDSVTGDLGWEIYSASPDGSSLTRLMRNPGDDIEPTWSRDGRWIAFTSSSQGVTDISVMSATEGLPYSLTKHRGENVTPRWGLP